MRIGLCFDMWSCCADLDFQHIRRAAAVADGSAGLSQPHPNAGCVLVSQDGRPLCETFQRAQVSSVSCTTGTAALFLS